RTVPAGAAIVAGAALLLLRPTTAADPNRAWILGLVYASVLAMSVAPRLQADRPRLHPLVVLAAGAAAVLLVRLNADRVVPPSRYAVGIALSLGAAVAEEAYFRRLWYAGLARFGAAAAVAGAAVVFAAMHYPGYGFAAMPVDFGAGLLLGWQRWASGSWTISAVTHGLANLLVSV
ncbi:MAG: CPBP family intramembrane glutamic endopeptidase, partial [Actinomycetota bacterium]